MFRSPGCIERVGSGIAGRPLNGRLRVAWLTGDGNRAAVAVDSGNRDHSQYFGEHCELNSDSRMRLAAAADALDFAVEGGVFLAQGIVRIAQVFLAGHIADARLAMADRRLDHPSASASASTSARIFRHG